MPQTKYHFRYCGWASPQVNLRRYDELPHTSLNFGICVGHTICSRASLSDLSLWWMRFKLNREVQNLAKVEGFARRPLENRHTWSFASEQ
jgi:hypothetical protein